MIKILVFMSAFFLGINTSHSPAPLQAPPNSSAGFEEEDYRSGASQKELPYYFIEPQGEVEGIFIYMHGAGGGYEQGMSDELFKGNFKTLKESLQERNFLYVTPETTDFEITGGKELVDLIFELKKQYGDLPVYLSGASAGGRTIFYTLQEAAQKNLFLKGVIFICPALSGEKFESLKMASKETAVWIEVGEKDTISPPDTAVKLLNQIKEFGNRGHLTVVENGDHNAPVEQVYWGKALDYIK